MRFHRLGMLLRLQLADPAAENALLAALGEGDVGLVDERESSVEALERHHHGRVVHDRLELRFFRTQRRVRFVAFAGRGGELLGLLDVAPVCFVAHANLAREHAPGEQQQHANPPRCSPR